MSSNRAPDHPAPDSGVRRWWRPRGWTLRARLVVTLLGLLALICVIVGVTTQVVLRNYLMGQVDNRLGMLAHLPIDDELGSHTQPPPHGCPEIISIIPAGQAGTLRAQFLSDGVTAQYQNAQGCPVALPASVYSTLRALPVTGKAENRSLGSLGDYRLVAVNSPARPASPGHAASPGGVYVTGLPLKDIENITNTLTLVELSVMAAGLLIAGGAGTLLIRRSLGPLRRVAATASRVSELPLDRGEVALSERVSAVDTDPRTEVGQVGSALNRMLGHVAAALHARQQSEMRVRQFVADASHELRTPLAAIRGYAELSRRMDAQVPPDVAHAMRRVESETARMTTLVEDLLLLARLDSGRPLAREPVDLSGLVVDAVSDAHIAGPDHRWTLDLPDEPVVVTGDAQRLQQVLGNLLANARTHTPAGTRVTVGLSEVDGGARLSIADNGPGIPDALLPDVFDRFARADTSRSRAAGSTGLGLAIVAAVVESHHGAVSVASGPDGTEFTVTLPRS